MSVRSIIVYKYFNVRLTIEFRKMIYIFKYLYIKENILIVVDSE